MKIRNQNIILIIILISVLSSCSIFKTAEKSNSSKEESKFIYLFSEANKNRLLGNNSVAIQQYMSAIDIKPSSAASNFYLSTIFIIEKKYETALKFAENAVKLQPDNLWYNLAKADILIALNKIKSAVIIYESLIKEYPKNELFYNRLIRVYSNEKDYINLSKIYEQKLKKITFDHNTAISLHELYMKSGETKKAEELLKEIIINSPNEPKYKILQAEYYISVNEQKKAQDLYNELLSIYPDNSNIRLSYSYYCKYFGKKEEYYKNVFKLMSSDLNVNEKINLLISGQYPNFPKEKYFELLNKLYKHNSNDISVNTLFAEYYISQKNNKEAINYVRKANELSNSNFNLVLTLFELSYDAKQFDDLFKDTEKYKYIYPNRPKVFLYNGIAAYKTERYNEAIKTLETGIDLIIDDDDLLVQFYYYLAETYHKTQDHKNSDKYFEKILIKDSKFYVAVITYSIYLSKREENLEKAESLSKICLENDKNNDLYNFAYSLVLLKRGKYSEALNNSTKFISSNSFNKDYLELHGDILFSNGKKEEALVYWKLSETKGNTDEHLKYKIININKLKISEIK